MLVPDVEGSIQGVMDTKVGDLVTSVNGQHEGGAYSGDIHVRIVQNVIQLVQDDRMQRSYGGAWNFEHQIRHSGGSKMASRPTVGPVEEGGVHEHLIDSSLWWKKGSRWLN